MAPAAVLKTNHQTAEPTKTPSTMSGLFIGPEADRDENTAAKDNIVIGLVRVNNRVDRKLIKSPRPSTLADRVATGRKQSSVPDR